MSKTKFSSWLGPFFAKFVALKQASGAAYGAQVQLLRQFDVYLEEHAPKPPLQTETLHEYLRTLARLSGRGRDNCVSVVWQALAYARRHSARVRPLPARPPCEPPHTRLREPRLLSESEIARLLVATRALPLQGSRPATYATLFGLLWTTGLRIGEALALDVADLDLSGGLLTVRRGKFGKARVLPLQASTVHVLGRYLSHPERPVASAPDSPVFVSGRRRRLSHPAASQTLHRAFAAAGLADPRPRLHDLRHSFAVHRVCSWYSEGRDVDVLLPALSTYLGHVAVENTRTYLRANGLLFHHALARFEGATRFLDEVTS